MPRRPKALVLDSWAVLAYLEDEASGPKVADIIAGAQERPSALMMSVVNAGEVWYILARQVSEAEADRALAELCHLGVQLVDADWNMVRLAGAIKAKRRMSYADCFAAALAKHTKADLVTGDKEFRQIENEIKILWL